MCALRLNIYIYNIGKYTGDAYEAQYYDTKKSNDNTLRSTQYSDQLVEIMRSDRISQEVQLQGFAERMTAMSTS